MAQNDKKRLLVADDEHSITEGLSAMLELEGYETAIENNGRQTLERLKKEPFDLALIDLMMPGLTGLEILREVKRLELPLEIIIITGQGSIDTAVEAIKEGAYDYLTKPVDPKRIRSLVPKALEKQSLVTENRMLVDSNEKLRQQVKSLSRFEDMIGQDERMLEVFNLIDAVADTTANVFITGESGTGKELVARGLHNKSSRRKGPFIAVNCSAFPRDILENELFGHEKGAFTGAVREKAGCFEMADKGTLFLDEIGEMPADTQSKLLRVLEDGRFRRLGGSKEIAVDVRVVAATNRDIQQALKEGLLREDLFFRLSVMDIDLPPLRERMGDLMLIADEFLRFFSERNNKNVKSFSKECQDVMLHYHWPGNIRELRNLVERVVILCKGEEVQLFHLPRQIFFSEGGSNAVGSIELGKPLGEIEKEVIFRTLEQTNNNKTKAAQLLGISLKTLHNKLNKYFLDTED